jgi:hypothetical protein
MLGGEWVRGGALGGGLRCRRRGEERRGEYDM